MIPITEQKLTKEDYQNIKEEENKIYVWIPIIIIIEAILIWWLILEEVYVLVCFFFLFFGIMLFLLISGLLKINKDTLKGTKLVGQVKVTYKLSDGIKDTTYHIDCCDSNANPIFNLIKIKYEEYNQTNIGDIFDVEYLAISKKRLKFKRVNFIFED